MFPGYKTPAIVGTDAEGLTIIREAPTVASLLADFMAKELEYAANANWLRERGLTWENFNDGPVQGVPDRASTRRVG